MSESSAPTPRAPLSPLGLRLSLTRARVHTHALSNHFNSTSAKFVDDASSRLLIMEVSEANNTATETWELVLEDQTCIYGDNDRLPTGNLLASSWPLVIDDKASFQYDARIFETVRSTKETAWEAFIVGRRCTDPDWGSNGCVRTLMGGLPRGWSMYR